ncbi:MAG: glutamate racemase [Candidatus Omnitrophota bacterium]|nr:glutamate racemase [Candidatus Omnitrophota bacterium]
MSDSRPVGIFDSGVGGLTVFSEVEKALPREEIVYFGDTARVPYGTKSKETVTKFSVENVEFLMKHNVKLVLVACNTASSLSLGFLKRCFRVPIIGVIEPGARNAVNSTRNNRIGVVGTSATIASGAYEKAVKKISRKIAVYSQSCPLFVPLVEEGWIAEKVTCEVASVYLKGLKSKGVDTLILGCTHYPLLKNVIKKFMGNGVTLVDSAREVAKEARSILDATGLLNETSGRKRHKFFVSDEPGPFIRLSERFLKREMKCVKRAI